MIAAEIRKPNITGILDGLNNIGNTVSMAYTATLTYNGFPSKINPMGLANLRNETTDEPSIDNMIAAAHLEDYWLTFSSGKYCKNDWLRVGYLHLETSSDGTP